MKLKSVLFLLTLFVAQLTVAQNFGNTGEEKKASIKWLNEVHDFGEIPKDKPVEIVFKFKNEGLVPILIKNVESTCGCTVPEYSQKPIAYGQTGEIKATYDAKSLGSFYKAITVYTNAGKKELRLQGVVVK